MKIMRVVMDSNSGLTGILMIIERKGTLLSHCFLSRKVVGKMKSVSLNLDALCDQICTRGLMNLLLYCII